MKEFWIVITHPSGFARLQSWLDAPPKTLRLTAWARIEGTFRIARKLQPNVTIGINPDISGLVSPNGAQFTMSYSEATDANGRFVFEHVAPGPGRIGQAFRMTINEDSAQMTSAASVAVNFRPGRTTSLDLGASGRPVIGQLRLPPDMQPEIPWRCALIFVRPLDPQLREADLRLSATANRAGNFCVDDIPIGNYVLLVHLFGSPRPTTGFRFSVPPTNEKLSQRPVDLGVLTLKADNAR